MSSYIAIAHKDRDSDYGVSFPDFPGCVTAAATLDEARALAPEALAFHIEGMVEDGAALPTPSSLDAVMDDPDFRDGVAFLVYAIMPSGAMRLDVTLPGELVREIDRVADDRSRFLADAARAKLRESV